MGRPILGIRKISSCFTLTVIQKDYLKEMSEAEGVSQSSLIGAWIETAYAEKKKKKAE